MPDQLTPRLSKLIGLEKNWVLRFAPLFAKDAVLALADWMVTRETTTTVSNLGRIVLDERIAPFVRDVNIMSSTNGLNFTLCSFGDDLSIGISTAYSNPDVVKNLVRFFSGQGIEGRININKTSAEVAEDRLEAKLETSVKRLSGQAPGKGEAR